MARNDALASGHIVINSSINSQTYFINVTEKLIVNHCFWSYTQLQTSLVPRPFLYGRGERGEGREGLVNNSTPTPIHGISLMLNNC